MTRRQDDQMELITPSLCHPITLAYLLDKTSIALVKRIASLQLLLLCLLAACGGVAITPTAGPARPVPTLVPTAARLPTSPAMPTAATPAPDTGWVAGRQGLEVRHL